MEAEMQKWIVTGISGCGRIELLNEVRTYALTRNLKILVHDVGAMMFEESRRQGIPVTDERILDMDQGQLKLLRTAAARKLEIEIIKNQDADLHLIGTHATFRWKNRLIPGISYQDVLEIDPNGFINVVHDIKEVFDCNKRNKKWDALTLPSLDETQHWMIEEEFVTEVLANVIRMPIFIVARNHNVSNLTDLFFTSKKKIYLSYPITAVRDEEPDLLARIQGPILSDLESMFVVFNPMSVEDMPLTYPDSGEELPGLIDQLTSTAKELIKKRTIERDFQFIDQSDAVVVFYLTDKLSPGVLAEIYYAHRNQKPVFMVYSGKKSPFIEDAATYIESDIDTLMQRLKVFAYG